MLPESWMFDYETLRVIWWILLGVLLAGVAVMDGFDYGIATLLPILGKTEEEKRVMINTIGPVWEGNQVWLILGAGAIFAAFPAVYALAFSGFYLAMFLVLCSLILRPVSFKFRQKVEHKKWKLVWDTGIFLSGLVPSLVFGVAVGNVLQGVPFHYDDTMRIFYDGNFWQLFNPFALLCGIISLVMLTMHGAVYLTVKADESLVIRAKTIAIICAVILIILYITAGFWVFYGLNGYRLTGVVITDGVSNPLNKTVEVVKSGLGMNFLEYKLFTLIPILVVASSLLLIILLKLARYGTAFIASALAVACVVATAGFSSFPFLIPSSNNPNSSLTIWDASSSRNTLFIMLIAAIIFVPMVLAYTSWVYNVLRGRVTKAYIKENSKGVY